MFRVCCQTESSLEATERKGYCQKVIVNHFLSHARSRVSAGS